MANEFDNEMTVAKDAIRQHQERMQKSEDAHMRCTGSHGDAEPDQFDAVVESAGTVLGHLIGRYPLSIIWMIGAILVGIGTGCFFTSLGWGCITLVIGWVIYRLALFVR